ncbi:MULTISPECIES: DNA translocase FtsK [unclassified Paenibacillus]|uniref:DNA translocase FtsK n=1 Tax=unclassified Paenibacillus TaxID=185978 RepID=UPI000954DD9A|nr:MULTISPECIES: DNA translocase FtsK [unclassified Paenibacillus]ASS65658.2 DNA translocase FtsK [Paenibacillus sp. RUD330]SIQ28195.1 DNA segregation ATPase FtsK/SpoIIIE, S-DNA-T family [Paenibacillus sp. RU4X]SIQ50447.1 DNA segregation ATPase FtsK/SpoIIIE, S-DNA-T family [Paenibacillus sp. RU4T]
MLAKKRRRKRRTFGENLKYEVYGILLITVSVIALSGEATVGRSLSKLFELLLGKFYFVLALVGIAVGLYVMVTRSWPTGWTYRRTGILLLVFAFTLMSSMSEIDRKLGPGDLISGSAIMQQLGQDIREGVLSTGGSAAAPAAGSISGGYLGAIQYSLLYTLFGYFGAKLLLIVMFAISLMLITGRSYVDIGRVVRIRAVHMIKLLQAKAAARPRKPKPPAAAAQPSATTSGRTAAADHLGYGLNGDDDDDYGSTAVSPSPRKGRSLFFSWGGQSRDSQEADADGEWMIDEEPAGKPAAAPAVSIKAREAKERPPAADPAPWDDQDEEGEDWEDASFHGNAFPADPVPGGQTAGLVAEADGTDPGEWLAEDDFPAPAPSRHPAEISEALAGPEGDGEPSPAAASAVRESKPYRLPPLSLLAKPANSGRGADTGDLNDSRRKLEATLESFGVRAKVLDVVPGPAVTRYEVQPATGVKVSRIVSLTDDIALALAAKDIRMEAPIPGKSAIGIEVPNAEVAVVTMREVMETPTFSSAASKLSIAFGRDIAGQSIVGNLAKMPHLLVAGATGSGKSVCINGIITSILYKAAPDEVKFMMIDPKMVELNMYNGIPHLLAPVVTDPRRASLALKKIVVEMEKRYELFSKSGTRNIEGYNGLMKDNPAAVLPYIVVIVDELADLMMVAAKDVEDSITRLAQMARAAGIHLIIATQRPSVDVITGVIKANIPSRIAFGVSSQVDSRTILDMVGAEKLLGRGDMLFLPVGMSKPIRVQGAFLSDSEVEAVVDYARSQAAAEYKEDLVPELDDSGAGADGEVLDELFDQAMQIVVDAQQASVSLLQRRMRVGYTRAARLVDQLEAKGVVGPYEGSKPREVLMTADQFQASQKHA